MPEEEKSTPEPTPAASTSSEMDPKVSSLLSYLLGIIGGIIFYAISKNSYVRFHAMQSIIASVAVIVLYVVLMVFGWIIPFLWVINWLINLGILALWIVLMVKAYQGEKFKLPVIGDMAEKYAK